jgi:serpin B
MDDSDLVAESVTRFALDLYCEIGKVEGNLFFSPVSIAIALSMTLAGAKGETAREMARTLNLPDLEPSGLHAAFGFLLSDLSYEYAQPKGDEFWYEPNTQAASGEKVVDPTACLVRMANAIWGQAGLEFLQSYRHVLKSFYESELHQVDFAANPQQARRRINSWVADKTLDKIPELLPPGILNEITRLVLTNAVYFKAQWNHPFSESETKQQPFFLMEGTTQPVDMMHIIDDFWYTEDDLVQVLSLPYAGGRFVMLIILPKEKNGLRDVESRLSFERLRDWRKSLTCVEVDLLLPKFEFRQQIMLTDVLREMGMRLAFDDTADFSGMAGIEPLKKNDERLKPENLPQNIDELPIVISEFIHEAFINLDEKGAEAAAATGVVIMLGGIPDEEPKVEFHADHSFGFAIMETSKGVPLFMGRMEAPKP